MTSILPMMGKVSHGDRQDKGAHNVTTKVISFNMLLLHFSQYMVAISMVKSESLCVPYLNAETLFISCQTISPYQECNISPANHSWGVTQYTANPFQECIMYSFIHRTPVEIRMIQNYPLLLTRVDINAFMMVLPKPILLYTLRQILFLRTSSIPGG